MFGSISQLFKGGALADELSLRLGDFTDLCLSMLGRAICEEPPAPLKEGGIFADGYSDAIDELRKAASEGKQWGRRAAKLGAGPH